MKRLCLIVLTLALAACGGGHTANFSDSTKRLEVMSWWVSPSERPAFETLLNAFKKADPDVDVVDGSIAGGAGSNVQVALAARLQAGDPPDVWQTFLGSSLRAWVNANRITDVTKTYQTSGLGPNLPPALLAAATYRNAQWGVPTGSHRGNVLWFNRKVLNDSGIAIPGADYRPDAFIADLAKIAASGRTPLCLGSKDRFTTVELFENTLLGVIGPEGWKHIQDDSFDWRGPQVRAALARFGDIVTHADPNAGAVTWDSAAKKLASGQCAFLSMNDSVYGELEANNASEGTDFGYVAYPGTTGAYLAIVDTFVVSSATQNGLNALKFLDTIANPQTSLAFNKIKGSVPVRKDVDVSTLPAYQRQASQSLWHDAVLLSITHGELMPPAFQQAMYDAVAAYIQSRNVNAFIDTLQNSVVAPIPGR